MALIRISETLLFALIGKELDLPDIVMDLTRGVGDTGVWFIYTHIDGFAPYDEVTGKYKYNLAPTFKHVNPPKGKTDEPS